MERIMKILFYKGIENPPELYGIRVNYLIGFFLLFLLHILTIGFVWFIIGLWIFILEPVLLYGYYRLYKHLAAKTNRAKKILKSKKNTIIQHNLYSQTLINNDPINQHRY